MNEKKIQQAFIQFLAQKYQLKSQQELETKIKELGNDGLKAEYAEFQKVIAQQQSRKMMFGAKLNYIKGLKGQCPQGYEMKYYKECGRVCAKCEAIKQQVPMNPIDAFKYERKMKKKACGGSVQIKKKLKGRNGLKTPYKSELGYTQNRGGGVQYVHRVYPENDSYYIDMQYNDELYGDDAKRFMYNPTGAEFNYDDYDYSKTVPAKRYKYEQGSSGKYEPIEDGTYEFFSNGNIDPNITGGEVIEYLKNLNLPLKEPRINGTGTPYGYRGTRVFPNF